MVSVEPIPGAPAATARLGDDRVLLIADYHAGIEAFLRYREGVSVRSRAADRRASLVALVEDHAIDEVIIVGDLMHSIGQPGYSEREEIDDLVAALPSTVSLTVVKGNHDGEIEQWLEVATVVDAPGYVRDGLAVSHGHTWPPEAALTADVLVIGHEHPRVRLEDSVGGATVRRAWLRGHLNATYVAEHFDIDAPPVGPELVVMPAFNELSGGTWVNVEGESFLVPYLPEGLLDGTVYLLDGTHLGSRTVV